MCECIVNALCELECALCELEWEDDGGIDLFCSEADLCPGLPAAGAGPDLSGGDGGDDGDDGDGGDDGGDDGGGLDIFGATPLSWYMYCKNEVFCRNFY